MYLKVVISFVQFNTFVYIYYLNIYPWILTNYCFVSELFEIIVAVLCSKLVNTNTD